MKRLVIIALLTIVKAEAQSSALGIADSLYVSGDYIQAINQYSKVGTQESSVQIARAYNAVGNYDKAILQYQSVVAKDTSLQIALFELGKLQLKKDAPTKALKSFLKLTQDNNKNAEYQYQLGRSFLAKGEPELAITSFKHAFELDSTHLRSIYQLGKYYVVRREKELVLKYVDVGLDFYENDVSLINWKALAIYNNDEFDKAIPWFEKLIELGEHKAYIYTKLAYCYYQNWDMDKAKETYHILLDMDDDNKDAYFNLGQVFWKDRQLDSAKYYIQKSIDVQRLSFDMEYVALARLAGEQKNEHQALKYYKLAYMEDPTNYANYFQICRYVDLTNNDLKKKLLHYENFIQKFGKDRAHFSEYALHRISELKAEIHFSTD